MSVQLYQGDCLEVMRTLPTGSIDAIITDLPYGTTACKWDEVIPFAPMWEQVKRVLKPRGVFVTTASQPFTSALVMSNPDWFKWEDVWRKSHATGHLNCKVMPLRQHENILVFGKGRVVYNPQISRKNVNDVRVGERSGLTSCYGKANVVSERTISYEDTYPRSVIDVPSANNGERGLHPTQKPVALYAYLIRTYTNPGDMVADICCGSGTTGVACAQTGRNFIGIELDPGYFAIAQKRIEQAQAQMPLLEVVS